VVRKCRDEPADFYIAFFWVNSLKGKHPPGTSFKNRLSLKMDITLKMLLSVGLFAGIVFAIWAVGMLVMYLIGHMPQIRRPLNDRLHDSPQ
jgi:hypothetical protein